MQNISHKNIDQSSVQLMSPSVLNSQSWINSSESQVPQSALSNALSIYAGSPRQHCCKGKQSSYQVQDQDSSSTQSTGQSHIKMPSVEGGNTSKQSACDEVYGKRVDTNMKSVVSLGDPDLVYHAAQLNYSHTFARLPYPYPDPYFSGILAPCGPQAAIHPQMMNMAFARVPLPLDPAEDEPIYVNPKQYRGILRRRESRAKLEAQNKLIKARKPYLHESRHLHALKRVRGNGGRFLNTKKSENSDERISEDNQDGGEMAMLKLGGNQLISEDLKSDTSYPGPSAASCSETSSVSGGYNMLHISNLRFPSYPSHMNEPLLGEGGIMYNGSQYRVPVIR